MKENQYRNRRTVPGWKKRSPGTVLFVQKLQAGIIFAALLAGVFLLLETVPKNGESGQSYYILRESSAGKEKLPLEEYVTGALAACMPEVYEEEACMAQAVILRTNAVYACLEAGETEISYESLGQTSLTRAQMQNMWKEEDAENYEKIKSAVEDTKGVVLCYNGVAADFPYFSISAGTTRDGEEVLGKKNCPYLKSVNCGQDITAPDYLQKTNIKKKEFIEKMKTFFNDMPKEANLEDFVLIRDGAGYVLYVVFEKGESTKRIPGELLRREFFLPSSHFTWEETEKEVVFFTKGIGHGLGLSQYTANEMAQKGADYVEILQYFFADCEIQKN